MTASPPTLRPENGGELLSIVRQLDNDTEKKANVKRDIVRAFLRTPVLQAGTAASPLVLPSTETGVFTVFTDEEAAEAWAAERHPDAPHAGWELVAAEDDERAARSAWLDRLEASGAAVISVNPNGPFSFLVYHHELASWQLRFRRTTVRPGEAPWLDLEARARERVRLRAMMERLAEVVDSRQLASMEAMNEALKTRHAFGSSAIATETRFLLDRWRLHFHQYFAAIHEMRAISLMRALNGDPWRAVDSLLEAAEHIRRLNAEGVEDPEHPGFLEEYWSSILRTLQVLTVPYREEERAALESDQPTFAKPTRRPRSA